MYHEPAIFVGVDISQYAVGIAVQPGTVFQVSNDVPGITRAVECLQTLQPTLIMLGATGGSKCHWQGCSQPPHFLSQWLIPGRCGTLRERRNSSRRRIDWMDKSSPVLLKRFARRATPSRMSKHKPWRPSASVAQ